MAVDQKLALINERIDQSNNKAGDFKQELEKYEQQFELLRKDQSNVREELVNYKEKGKFLNAFYHPHNNNYSSGEDELHKRQLPARKYKTKAIM